MNDFRRTIGALRNEFPDYVRIGLEVELDADGHLTLRDEDRDWPDLLVGAVHFLPRDHAELSDEQLADLFMQNCRGLIAGGIDVLAHPWRFFQWVRCETPTHLYETLAQELAVAGVAAEINRHSNVNDEAFLAECLDLGVKIALGSDTHAIYEAGSLVGHLEILRRAAGREDVGGLLWRP